MVNQKFKIQSQEGKLVCIPYIRSTKGGKYRGFLYSHAITVLYRDLQQVREEIARDLRRRHWENVRVNSLEIVATYKDCYVSIGHLVVLQRFLN